MNWIRDFVLWLTSRVGDYVDMDIVYSNPEYLDLLPLVIIILFLLISLFINYKISQPKITKGSIYPFFTKTFGWILITISLFWFIIAAARPGTQKPIYEEVDPLQIWIMVDRSLSMNAQDITYRGQNITRLEAAQDLVRSLFVEDIVYQGDRVSLIDFGFISRLKTPPTVDQARFLQDLEKLSFPRSLGSDQSIWGTDLSKAFEFTEERIRKWEEHLLEHFNVSPVEGMPEIIIVLADGENEEGYRDELLDSFNDIANEGIRIYSIGIGSPQGVPWLSLLDDRVSEQDYPEEWVEDWGSGITRLEAELLLSAADITGGDFYSFDDLNQNAFDFIHQAVQDNRVNVPVIIEGEENEENLSHYPIVAALILIVCAIFFLKE